MRDILNTRLVDGLTVQDLLTAVLIFVVFLLVLLLARLVVRRLVGRWQPEGVLLPVREIVFRVVPMGYTAVFLLGSYLAIASVPAMSDSFEPVSKIFAVAAIVVMLTSLLRAQGVVFSWYERRLALRAGTQLLATIVPLLRRSAGIVVMVLGTLVIMAQLGIEIAPLLAGLGIGGLAVALALQGTLGNFFAGVSLLSDGTVQAGDLVELEGGNRGYVHEIGWRATQIRTLENNMIIIPNSRLADTKTLNYSYITQQMALFFRFGVSYFSDLEQVERVTLEVATWARDETEGSVKSFEPILRFTGFGDSNIDTLVILRAEDWASRWLLGHNFTKALMRRYGEEGIEISFPARNVWMRDGLGGYAGNGDAAALGERPARRVATGQEPDGSPDEGE